jgi:hypothetical protein
MSKNVYHDYERACSAIGTLLKAGEEASLPQVPLAHYPITDTALTACLGTLGVIFREPGPFTDDVDERTGFRRKCFWVSDRVPGKKEKEYKTEWLCGAWDTRALFEKEHPLHPFVSMRAAIDARAYWCEIANSRGRLPESVRTPRQFQTSSIREASVLKALGFKPLAFSGRAFVLEDSHNNTPAKAVLEMAQRITGASPAQWMWKALINFDLLLRIAKDQVPIIQMREGDSTLLLSAEATTKTRDKFHALL